ncbi:MAG: flagellar basal-body rod protein FlgF [Alphaproteobacteria bacterium RIFOXYD12_FULL_60_8]|nr:MAG: flagellar basal-body rod protein FlgF [Alphaproteobacteria bacterium RIFOXYD12_FULL_60_8]
MDNTSYIALSKQTALVREMAMVANNIANVNTPAYKGEDSLFTQYLVKVQTEDRILTDSLAFTRDLGTMRNMDEGRFQSTGNTLDMAIHGKGYFVVETPDGPQYTRKGHFRLDQDGQLVTNEGRPVLTTDNQPLFFAPNEAKIDISRDGSVSTENGPVGKLRLVQFDNEQDMKKVAHGLFKTDQLPQDVPKPDIQQGMLEGSNVEPVVEITKMIAIHRSYDSVTKMIEEENQRQRKAITALTRITS